MTCQPNPNTFIHATATCVCHLVSGLTTTFIYGLLDPRSKKLKYVGKSDNPTRRLKQHIGQANKFAAVPGTKDCKEIWIKGLLDLSYQPEVVILQEVHQNRWQGAEKEWIKRAKEAGCDLYNEAPGGVWIPPKKRRPGRRKKSYRNDVAKRRGVW